FPGESLAKNIALAEGVALAQQAVLMSTGLEKKFDWKTQVGAAFNATVGAVTNNELDNELARIGIKTFAASGADAALNHHFDAGMMSANLLGSMMGSYAGSHITNDILKQQNKTLNNEQQSDDHHVAKMGQTDVDVKDPRWSEELSEMTSQKRASQYARNKNAFFNNTSKAQNTFLTCSIASFENQGTENILARLANSNVITAINQTGDSIGEGVLHPLQTINNLSERFKNLAWYGRFDTNAGESLYIDRLQHAYQTNHKQFTNMLRYETPVSGTVSLVEGVFAGASTLGEKYLTTRMGIFGSGEVNVSENLLARSLDNIETRKWYHDQLAQLPSKIDETLTLRERALQYIKLRNEIKLQARELMANQKIAKSLPPPETLKELVRKAYSKNQVGDDLWNSIINSSMRTNQNIDTSLGIQNPLNKNRY
ncbi:MAG: hypothetical protein P4M12_11055, partial [Gammaproteobacteria bacterium]|nr:hypothetical protein [Gammaproteobacteria bacterium]